MEIFKALDSCCNALTKLGEIANATVKFNTIDHHCVAEFSVLVHDLPFSVLVTLDLPASNMDVRA